MAILTPIQQIALQTGLPVSVIQFLFNLSRPVRQGLNTFIDTVISQLQIAKASAVMQSRRCDGISLRVQKFRTASLALLQTNNVILNALPLDTLYKEASTDSTIKSLADFLTETVRSLPVYIPAPVVELLGEEAKDFFSGVRTYQDLVDRIDQLEFKLARATAASTYAAQASSAADQYIQKLLQYKSAITLLGT